MSQKSVSSLWCRRITFLYRLTSGVADRSFGLNVARMARLPASVVERAAERAADMEAAVGNRQRCLRLSISHMHMLMLAAVGNM